MEFKIIVDSCCDLAVDSGIRDKVKKIPLTMIVDGEEFIDDESLNQKEYLKKIAASKSCPGSACPSPQSYAEAYDCEENNIFVVTLSSKLSGSYASACTAKNIYNEERDGANQKNIHVFDSLSASVGEARIAEKIYELASETDDFDYVVREAEKYRDEMNTFFVLENLETLRKNGRLSNIQALIATVLNIKPVLAGDRGEICKLGQARGIEKALAKMVEQIVEMTKNAENKVLAIAHCNCIERALEVKNMLLKMARFKLITISETSGLSTTYANDGGIIVAV